MLKKFGIAVMILFVFGPSVFLIGSIADAIWNDRVCLLCETREERHERIYGHTNLSDWNRRE